MSDIYEILSKHFAGASNADEALLAEKFKQEKPKEYQVLEKLWSQNKIELQEFDSARAWSIVENKMNPPKRISWYQSFAKVASVAAIFLILIGTFYFLDKSDVPIEIVELHAKEAKERLELADGSIIHINQSGRLAYPEKFNSNERTVKLAGEAFFEVQSEKNRPFIISTVHSNIQVLGTSFNINSSPSKTVVSVKTGKVEVKNLKSNKTVILKAGQSAIVDQDSIIQDTLINSNYLAWNTGVFHFEKTSIHQVVEDLNTYYDNKIKLMHNESDCLFSSTFEQQELQDVVKILGLTCELEVIQKNGMYELY